LARGAAGRRELGPVSYYDVRIDYTIKIDGHISYECENCGQTSSTTKTTSTSVYEHGQTAQKRRSQAEELSRELSLKAEQQANQIAQEWGKEKPYLPLPCEPCPHCGYLQSWMQPASREQQRSRYIKWPIGIMTVIVLFGYIFGGESALRPLVGDAAPPVAIGVWLALAVILYLVGKTLLERLDPNRRFGDVAQRNEPTIVWGEPYIEKS
jgi:hypothetical protein